MNAPPCPAVCPGDANAGAVAIETGRPIPLAEALGSWQREAIFDEFDTGRYRCRHFRWGNGPPLIFIHGLADRAMSFVPVIAPLRSHFTCVAYELPDGLADGARLGPIGHRDFVADLLALLDCLAMSRAYLFGSSFGSTIALSAMLEHPTRFPRGVLQGGFAHRPLSVWERRVSQFLRYRRARLADLWLRQQLQPRADRHERDIFRKHGRDDEWGLLMVNSGECSSAAAARRALLLDRLDLRKQLPRIRQPMLLIGGENDSIVPTRCEKTLLDGLPNAVRVAIPECGHYPQYTHGGLVAELVRQFLTKPG